MSNRIPHEVLEMDGHSNLGMHKEALEIARTILSRQRLKAVAFNGSLSVILVGGDNIETWKTLIQTAYGRLSKRGQQQVRDSMLGYYYSIKDMKTAEKFISHKPSELWISMSVLLETGDLDRAGKIFKLCRRLLPRTTKSFDRSALLAPMAYYCERIGRLEQAENYWLLASELDEPLLQNALSGLVKIQAVRALEFIRQGLIQIEKFKENTDEATVVRLPGNHDQLLADTKKELEIYREALEKIVPRKDLWQFGMNQKL